MRLPRATCPVCRGNIAVRVGGELRERGEVPKCPGSARQVDQAAIT